MGAPVCTEGCAHLHPPAHNAADGRVFALKQVKLEGMKRVDREEAIDEVGELVVTKMSSQHSDDLGRFTGYACIL